MFNYTISGLSVECDVELPGLQDLPTDEAACDVSIRAGQVPHRLDAATDTGPNWQMTQDRFLLDVPGIVRMLVSHGTEILYQLVDDGVPADAVVFIAGSGFGILLHQRDTVVLHASAVRVGDVAVLFCGASGAGKSTIAAALTKVGYDLAADDFCAISIDGSGIPHVAPDARQLKLWHNTIDRLDLRDARAAPVRRQLEKFYVVPRAATSLVLRVGAVYMLREARVPFLPGIVRPGIVDSAPLLRRHAYRPALVHRLRQQQLYFGTAAAICRQAGLYTFTHPFDFAHLPVGVRWLEEHWRALGILGHAA